MHIIRILPSFSTSQQSTRLGNTKTIMSNISTSQQSIATRPSNTNTIMSNISTSQQYNDNPVQHFNISIFNKTQQYYSGWYQRCFLVFYRNRCFVQGFTGLEGSLSRIVGVKKFRIRLQIPEMVSEPSNTTLCMRNLI